MPGPPLGTPDNPLRVAVIGSGPSGFYAAERLLNAEDLSVQVDIYDRLPTPFGLVRGGVAPDHQKIKSVTRVFDKIAAHPEFRFFGNVEMGRDLVRDEMLAYYHGDHLRGGRPHRPAHVDPARAPARQPLGHRVRRAGTTPTPTTGACASTCRPRARPWSATATWRWTWRACWRARASTLRPPTSPTTRWTSLGESQVRDIHVLGRRGPAQAAFTNKEIKELGELPGVDVIVDPAAPRARPGEPGLRRRQRRQSLERNLAILRGLRRREATGAPTRILLRFLVSPVEIVGEARSRRW